MIGIASRNLQMVHPLKVSLARNFSTKGIDLKATRFEDIKHIVSRPEDFVVRQAKPFCLSMQRLQKDLLVPHLKSKVDLIGGSYDETAWLLPDQRLLRDCESLVLRDASLDPIRPFLLELIRGMLTHSQHRPDILELNAGRVIPENGPLIREMYILSERASIRETSNLLKSFCSNDELTDAFLRSDIRRLIRNIVRAGATQHNAKLAARQSLFSSLDSFHKRYEPALAMLNIDADFKKILDADESDKPLFRAQLRQRFNHLFSSSLKTDSNAVLTWIDEQFQGLSFQDLIEKYMTQNLTLSNSLQKVSQNASTDNPHATKEMANQVPTKVTSRYKSDMVKYPLFRPAFTSSHLLRHEVVELQKEQ